MPRMGSANSYRGKTAECYNALGSYLSRESATILSPKVNPRLFAKTPIVFFVGIPVGEMGKYFGRC